jgi:hypothetical protein
MDSAKAAVKGIMTRPGQHDTTVCEEIFSAMQNEAVEKQKHEQYVSAIDKEGYQDRYHATEQLVIDKEILPEQHHVNVIPSSTAVTSTVAKTTLMLVSQRRELVISTLPRRSRARRPARSPQLSLANTGITTSTKLLSLSSIRVYKLAYLNSSEVVLISIIETIELHVVHTTVPIHVVHDNAAEYHSASALPAVCVSEVKQRSDGLTSREERRDGSVGEPSPPPTLPLLVLARSILEHREFYV